MVLTAIVHILRAVCRLFFNCPNNPEHTDPDVGIIKLLLSPTDMMVVCISSHTIRIWVYNLLLLILLKLTSSPES